MGTLEVFNDCENIIGIFVRSVLASDCLNSPYLSMFFLSIQKGSYRTDASRASIWVQYLHPSVKNIVGTKEFASLEAFKHLIIEGVCGQQQGQG